MINSLQKNLKDLNSKSMIYKKYHDYYLVHLKIFEKQLSGNDNIAFNNILDSTEEIQLDMGFPSVTISKTQKKMLEQIKNGGAATRALIDFLFEPKIFKGKNYSFLSKHYPEKISAIKNYVLHNYEIEEIKITKAITGKCLK